jgi:hypothetical protein
MIQRADWIECFGFLYASAVSPEWIFLLPCTAAKYFTKCEAGSHQMLDLFFCGMVTSGFRLVLVRGRAQAIYIYLDGLSELCKIGRVIRAENSAEHANF